jgi:hypothetical protein
MIRSFSAMGTPARPADTPARWAMTAFTEAHNAYPQKALQ